MRGFSFSWKRALGVSAAKGRVSRAIGIPLTRSGRERKIGRMASGAVASLVVEAGAEASRRSSSAPAGGGETIGAAVAGLVLLGFTIAAVIQGSWATFVVGLVVSAVLNRALARVAAQVESAGQLVATVALMATVGGALYAGSWWVLWGGVLVIVVGAAVQRGLGRDGDEQPEDDQIDLGF